jgi:phosphatidylinositol-4,5-bisphosphate 3-kinase
MPPSSGELWGHHLMPSQIDIDILLPTGIIVCMPCQRDSTLETIKSELWKEARKYPLFYLLSNLSSYIFVSVTQDATREEFYDETRRLCDLRLFQPFLKLIEPVGHKEEKMLNTRLTSALGMSVNDFDENKDLEVMTFRRNTMVTCKKIIDEREVNGAQGIALYIYPPDIHSTPQLPSHIMTAIEKVNNQILVCIWIVGANREGSKITMKVRYDASPDDVIAESIRRKIRTMNVPLDQQQQTVAAHLSSYVLKVCGCEEFLLGNYPLSQYRYIRSRLVRGQISELMLLSREGLYNGLPKSVFTMPSYVQRGVGALLDIKSQYTESLWSLSVPLHIKINVATYVNVRDRGEIYVKTGIYHGTEPLCPPRDTRSVISSNPKWHEWIEYELCLSDLPRSARLCVSLCSISKKQKRKVHYAIAWANINLFDFNNRLMTEKISIKLWPMPPGLDDLLNPIGLPGSNTSADAPCLEIEFEKFNCAVMFPNHNEILKYAESLESGLTEPVTESERSQVAEIVQRDPLSEVSEQEKELLWRLRYYCMTVPESLPKLLQAVKWSSRDDVAQLYLMLKSWPTLPPELALELLYCTFTDLTVRQFAVSCLEARLTDDRLSFFLLQLVQVLEFEPYLDNHLTQFLLRRALLSQRIGHFFFWYLRSAMHLTTVRLRFGLILEAYCRSCGLYLQSLCKQVEAVEKLIKLSDMLKEEREDGQQRVLRSQLKSADYMEALQSFPSPLNYSHILGDLMIEQCDVKSSKKRPLFLVWKNPDQMAQCLCSDFQIIFKSGDDLRQDMLTLQIISMMDAIWQSEGLDLRMTPYRCMATGLNVGMIEVVRNSKTVMHILKQDIRSAMMVRTKELHNWIKDRNKGSMSDKTASPDSGDCQYSLAIETFTRSCAGYCVATFVLGIGDRHPSNIMVTEDGQVFHIDFGHFLDHRKKKFGVNRERVPFVLTEDFIRVIAKGQDNPEKSTEFYNFMELCGKAYLSLRKHANIFITLLTMMLSCGIPELQSLDDIGYIRSTLCVDMRLEQDALDYFQRQFSDAYGGAWTTKLDWFFHWLKHRNS